MKHTLLEVKVQGSDVAAECENVTEASSHPPPRSHSSHCCYSSRWGFHRDADTPVFTISFE